MSKSNYNITTIKNEPRKGCLDMWNAFMVQNAKFDLRSDIPICPCTLDFPPIRLISYGDAKSLYKNQLRSGNEDFFIHACIHFYMDDQKFDGKKSSIWTYPEKAWEVIKHFSCMITPDFSTFADIPDPIKRYNTYRMRAFGCWIDKMGIPVINNVRWGTLESWTYCFDGIPHNSIVSIGTVASSLKTSSNWSNFEDGLFKMAKTLTPHTIIVYGSANYPFFNKLKENGIKIIAFPSKTNEVFARRKNNE